MWVLWKGRNSTVFKNESLNLRQVVQMGIDMYTQYRAVVVIERPPQLNVELSCDRWKCPSITKLNCDAALYGINGISCATVGFIVRGPVGELLIVGRKRFRSIRNTAITELRSLLWALMVWSQKLVIHEMEMDCLQVAAWIKDRKFTSEVGQVVEAGCMLLHQLNSFEILHRKKEANMVAHGIAKSSMVAEMD